MSVPRADFRRAAARRIAAVTIALSCLVAPLAWYAARDRAESRLVSFSIEESRRLISHFDAIAETNSPATGDKAKRAVEIITSSLFDVAKIYNKERVLVAEAFSAAGQAIWNDLPRGIPKGEQTTYESLSLRQDRWVLRVTIPLYAGPAGGGALLGYFEGARVIPDWQRRELGSEAISVALIAALAALLCGVAIYPMIRHLSVENEQKSREVLDSHISMMAALGRAIANRDSDTGAHNYRVAWIATKIGEKFELSESAMQSLIAGSFLHDVGKIGIPDSILLKPGPLSDAEMTIMKTHVTRGEEIVAGMGWLEGIRHVVAGHHEKWDGSGYPRRLAAFEIPLAARIFAVADVFDALSSKRPYKEAVQHSMVMDILRRDTGAHFDPEVMRAFESVADEVRVVLADHGQETVRILLYEQIRRYFDL